MGGVKKVFRTVAHYATGGLISKGSSSSSEGEASSGAQAQGVQSSGDTQGGYDSSREVTERGVAQRGRKGKSSLKVSLGGRNLSGDNTSRRGLNVV